MLVSLKTFIQTTHFGTVKIGDDKASVLEILGCPSCDTDLGETGSILLYGWYELFFDHTDCLSYIQNDSYNPHQPETYQFKNEHFEIDAWFFNDIKHQTIETVSILLEQASISFDVINYYGRAVIKTESGVIIDFDDEKDPTGTYPLLGFRYSL